MRAPDIFSVFLRCISEYQRQKDIHSRINQPFHNPYPDHSLENLLYHKNFIDGVQWDLEDLIRDPDINPEKALQIKRRIDKSNQDRTDMVEKIDDLFLDKFKSITPEKDARLNTESIAWAIDRLSILALKIYHMQMQAERKDTDEIHRQRCTDKLQILNIQEQDLTRSIDQLLDDIRNGRRIFKVYRQMKMYNDPSLNPVLYEARNRS